MSSVTACERASLFGKFRKTRRGFGESLPTNKTSSYDAFPSLRRVLDATLLLQAYTNAKFFTVLHGQVPSPWSGDEAHRRAYKQDSWVLGERRFSSLVRGDEGRSWYLGSQRRNHSVKENLEITEGCMWMAERAEEVENSKRIMQTQTPRPPTTPPPPSQDPLTFSRPSHTYLHANSGNSGNLFSTYGIRMLQARGGEENGALGQAGKGKTEPGGGDGWIRREEPPITSTASILEDRERGSIDTLLSFATTDEISEDGNEEIALDGVPPLLVTRSYSSTAALTNGHGTKGPESKQGAVLSPMMAVLQGATIVRLESCQSGGRASRQNVFVRSNEVPNAQGKSPVRRQIKAQHLLPPNPPSAQDQALMGRDSFLRDMRIERLRLMPVSTAGGEANSARADLVILADRGRCGSQVQVVSEEVVQRDRRQLGMPLEAGAGPFGGKSRSILKSRDQSSQSAVRRM